jgi:hypothetical protein
MDGLKLMLEQSNNGLIQEQYYNNWTHDHYVTSVLCFCSDGIIPIVFVNIPGAIHDSQVAEYGDIYDKLELVYIRESGKCTVDSAFGNVSRGRDFLIKSSQELIHIEDHWEQGIACNATSMEQSAEWGMRAFQLSMPRLKDWMKFDTRGEQRITLTMMILLYTLRAQALGINQLPIFYSPPLYHNANNELVIPLLNN